MSWINRLARAMREPLGRIVIMSAVVVVLGTGAFALHEISVLRQTQDEVVRSEQLLADAEALSSLTYQVESETRGYAFSGKEALLAARADRMDQAWDLWNTLARETLRNPSQAQRVARIQAAMQRRFAFLDQIAEARRQGGKEAVDELLARGASAPLRQDLQASVQEMEGAEKHLLMQCTLRTRKEAKLTKALILFAAFPAALGLGLMGLITIQLLRRSTLLQTRLTSVNGTLTTILNTVPVGIFSYSEETKIGFWNPAAESIFGLSAAGVIGEPLTSLPQELGSLLSRLQPGTNPAPAGGDDDCMVTWVKEAEKEVRLRLSSASCEMQDGEGTGFVAIAQDVTAFHRLEEELLHIAHHDSLTGLPNRVVLDDRCSQMLKRTRRDGKKCAVFEIDIDRFKQINDQHGHNVGDLFLREVAARLLTALRTTDTLVRVGGDEFVCLVESLHTEQDAELVAEKLLSSLTDPIALDGVMLHASISIGMSIYPTDGTQTAQLRKQADAALYRAKAAGKGQYKRYERNDADLRRRQIQESLERGIERGYFHIAYQPQYTKNSELRGFEALLRLTDPVLGGLSPAEFVPIAEHCGLIHEIGNWVLEEGCSTFSGWIARGFEPGILAVNVSAAQFVRGNFSEIVAETLGRTGLLPNRLELELTETMVMSDIDESSRQMHRLKKAGVGLAIDDFGTGYSSLNHLHRLPIDLIKIDRSFVSEIDQETATTRPIVEAIVGLGRSLAIETIAEGVETTRQRDYLCEIGCDYLQGYFFAKPLPVVEVEARLAREAQRLQTLAHKGLHLSSSVA